MPSSRAIEACLIFLPIISVFISVLSMLGIVLIIKTFVKMKNDLIISSQIGQRLKAFRVEFLKVGTQKLANKFNEDHEDEQIGRSQITNWEKSPGWEYLFWLNKRCKLNLLWALKGEPHKPVEI